MPAYYSILDLLKVYILLSPLHTQLPKNPWHGAQYDVSAKDSHNLLTEQIILHPNGAIPLAYTAITGNYITKKCSIKLDRLYRYVQDVEYEYETATGSRPSSLANIDFQTTGTSNGIQTTAIVTSPYPPNVGSPANVHTRQLQVLRGFSKIRGQPGAFASDPVRATDLDAAVRSQINSFLLYHPISATSLGYAVRTPISAAKILMPEELPIALIFFHMSSVVRYRPEFMAKIRDSKFWPLVSSAREHALYKLLLLFTSFARQESMLVYRI